MFDKLAKALMPFGATFIVISGLTLANRVQVVDRVMMGYVAAFIGVCMAIVYIKHEMQRTPKPIKRKD
jgi:hypothetical protein